MVNIYQKWSKQGTVVNQRQGHGMGGECSLIWAREIKWYKKRERGAYMQKERIAKMNNQLKQKQEKP